MTSYLTCLKRGCLTYVLLCNLPPHHPLTCVDVGLKRGLIFVEHTSALLFVNSSRYIRHTIVGSYTVNE